MNDNYIKRYASEDYVAEVVEPIGETVDEHSAFIEREKTGSFNPLLKCYKYDAYFGHQYDYFDPYWLPFPDTTEVNVPVLLYDLSSFSANSLKLWSYSTFESYVVQLTAVDGGQTGQYRRLKYYTKMGNYTVSAKLTKDMVTEIGIGNFMYEYSAFGWILYSIVDLASLPEEYVDMFPQKGVYYVRTAEDKNCPARLVWEACVDSVNAFAIPTAIARVADVDAGLATKQDKRTDEETIEMLIEADLLPAVSTPSGAVLTDQNGNVVLRY